MPFATNEHKGRGLDRVRGVAVRRHPLVEFHSLGNGEEALHLLVGDVPVAGARAQQDARECLLRAQGFAATRSAIAFALVFLLEVESLPSYFLLQPPHTCVRFSSK